MKKTIALLLTFAVFFSFAACRKDNASTPATTTASTATEKVYAATTNCLVTDEATAAQSVSAKEKTTLFSKVITTVTTTLKLTATTAKSTTNAPVTTVRKTTTVTTTAEEKNICTISINCTQIINNKNKLKAEKAAFVPDNGEILKAVTVEFNEGETAFDILKRVCSEYTCNDNCRYCQDTGIQLEYEFTLGYNNYYIEGIHQIYEKDCGSKSGWMYEVNGTFPNYGCSSYTVENGDIIEFVYTLNLGEDIGTPTN